MKYAIVGNQKKEAEKGLKGLCPMCNQPVIAKCGQFKVNHWAHKSCKHCDSWWENETEWHRQWKDLFPKEWQEVISYDEKTGEKHIADIKTDMDSVIEFQHSNISIKERESREKFYKNMMWVVDGTRRKNDFKHFFNAFEDGYIWRTDKDSPLLILDNAHSYLPNEWLDCSVPVYFDFKGLLDKDKENYDNDFLREPLWCLLPFSGGDIKAIIKSPRNIVIQKWQEGGFMFNLEAIFKEANQALLKRKVRILKEMY